MSLDKKQYQISFFKGEPVIVTATADEIKRLEDALIAGTKKYVRLKKELVAAADIRGVSEYRDYEAENAFEPEVAPRNKKNIALWRATRQIFNECLKKGERFDPYIHFPDAWKEKLPPKEELIIQHGTKTITLTPAEHADINIGSARIQWDAEPDENGKMTPCPYPVVVYDAAKSLAHKKQQWAQKVHIDDPLQALIDEAV